VTARHRWHGLWILVSSSAPPWRPLYILASLANWNLNARSVAGSDEIIHAYIFNNFTIAYIIYQGLISIASRLCAVTTVIYKWFSPRTIQDITLQLSEECIPRTLLPGTTGAT
jgi:hypothetical protein